MLPHPTPRRLLRSGLLLTLCACAPEPVAEEIDRADLDPKTMFVNKVQDALVGTCASNGGCHGGEMGLLKPFLTPGAEYDAITRYRNGFFLTDPPKDSELLNHGRHAGPALTEEQAAALLAWLELQVKTGAGQSLTTPSAALRSGDFFLSLERLVGDAQAKLTFSLDPLKTENAYLLRDLMLSVGPETGVRLTHPKVLLLSDAGVREDPADRLAAVDMTIPAGKPPVKIGSGSLILTQVKGGARIAFAFTKAERTDAAPVDPPQCKALALFNQGVRPVLAAPCAAMCHGGGLPTAKSAFDMSSASSMDVEVQKKLCLQTLSRVNLPDPGRSVIVLQATPAAQGGTPNHPYKLPSPAAFRDAVSAWAAAEKK